MPGSANDAGTGLPPPAIDPDEKHYLLEKLKEVRATCGVVLAVAGSSSIVLASTTAAVGAFVLSGCFAAIGLVPTEMAVKSSADVLERLRGRLRARQRLLLAAVISYVLGALVALA